MCSRRRGRAHVDADRGRLDPGAAQVAAQSSAWKSRSGGIPTTATRSELLARRPRRTSPGTSAEGLSAPMAVGSMQVALEAADVGVARQRPMRSRRHEPVGGLGDQLDAEQRVRMIGTRGGKRRDRLARRVDTAPARSRARRSCPARGVSSRRPWPRRRRCAPPRPGARLRPGRRFRHRSRPRRSAGAAASDLARPASSRRQVIHVQHAMEDPLVEAHLPQLVAVEDRPNTLPALLQERRAAMRRPARR